jgi:endonuclease III
MRVAQRLGLTANDKPEKIEQDLCTAFPREDWIGLGHRLLLHGRYVCTAKAPRCHDCPLHELCPAAGTGPIGSWRERAAAEQHCVEARGEA